MFIVNYEADFGHAESFGPFNTELEAIAWMQSDVEHNIENAKNNGVELSAQLMNENHTARIEDYGTWTVCKINNAAYVA